MSFECLEPALAGSTLVAIVLMLRVVGCRTMPGVDDAGWEGETRMIVLLYDGFYVYQFEVVFGLISVATRKMIKIQ